MNDVKGCRVASVVLTTFTRDSRVEKEAEALTRAGYAVTVYALAGGGLPQREERDGYVVERLPVRTRFLGGSFLGQAVKLVELSLRLAWRLRLVQIAHCHDFLPLPSALLARFMPMSRPLIIYDAHELESEKNGLTPFRSKCIRFLEKFAAHWLDALITVSPAIRNFYSNFLPQVKSALVLNCPYLWPSFKGDVFHRELGIPSAVRIVLYQGRFMPGRHVEELLEAFRAEIRIDRVLVFLGNAANSHASRSLERTIKDAAAALPNVFYLPAVPPARLGEYTGSADIGVSLIEDVCLSYRYCLPNKFFEFAMAGLPIVVSDLPEMRRMVEKYECGVICRPGESGGIRASLDKALSGDAAAMGANARQMAEDHCWEKQEEKLIKLYQSLLQVA